MTLTAERFRASLHSCGLKSGADEYSGNKAMRFLMPWALIFLAITTISAQDLNSGTAQTRTGNIFVADNSRRAVQWFSSDGTRIGALITDTETTGLAFDPQANLYVTGFNSNKVIKFPANGAPKENFGSDYDRAPESIVFDRAGNAFVGQAYGSRNILKFDSSGNLIASFVVSTENKGSDWLDLAADQCTMFYTSEGKSVKRFNVCANQQLPDLATGLPGEFAYALRLLTSGDLLVADTANVLRLDQSGTIVKTYDADNEHNWFALNLDPDGRSFWSAGYDTGNVYKFDIASGAQIFKFHADTTQIRGLAVKGEIVAAVSNPTPVENSRVEAPSTSKDDKTSSWSPIIVAIIGAIATVSAATIGLLGSLIVARFFRRKGRKDIEEEIEEAPRLYVDHLDRLIQNAVKEGKEHAVVNARAIVATARDLRDSTITISERLNSEIDRLGREVVEAEGSPEVRINQTPNEEIYQTIQVLARKWPAKKDQVEVEIRKILAELKLLGKPYDRG